MRLGIQLYTVRDHTDESTFRSTVETIAGMGFLGVEFAWKYGGMAPDRLAAFLDEVGLACCGLHLPLGDLLVPDSIGYAYAAACGSRYVTTSLCGQTQEFETLVPQLNEVGGIASAKGLLFTYHNHYQEFTDRVGALSAQDYLSEHTDAEAVGLEIDLGWIQKAGLDPMSYWRRHGARTPQVHLRDYSRAEDQVTDIGSGFIDMDAVVAQARELDLDWLIYEQDRYPVSPFDSCRVCIDRARAAGVL